MTLALEIHWLNPVFEVGGVMPAMITLRNHSLQAVQVPLNNGQNPFGWSFSMDAGQHNYQFSEADRDAMFAGGAPQADAASATVPADSALSYRVDLATALLEPIVAGRYQVVASLTTSAGVIKSSPTPVQINPPIFRSLSQRVISATQKLFTLALTEQGEQVVAISPRQHANLSVLRLLESEALAQGVTPYLAHLIAGDALGIWGGWLAESKLRGAFFEPNLITDHFDAGDLGFAADEILGAFQYDNGLASFVVSGQSVSGRQVKLVHLRGGNKFDIETLAAEPPLKAQVSASMDEQHRQVWLHWQEGDPGQAKIVSVNGSSGQKLQWQVANGQALLSWSVPSAWHDLSAFMIVEESTANTVKTVAQQLKLSDQRALAERVLPEMSFKAKSWILPRSSRSGLVLAALAENQLYWPDISGSRWLSEATATTATHVAIHSFDSQYAWLTWYTQNQGINFVNVFWSTEEIIQESAVP